MDRAFVPEPGSSPSRGPRNAASGAAYLYAETSQGNYNVDFDLVGSVAPGEEVYGITFEYYLFGWGGWSTRGTAVLETSADGDRCQDAQHHVHTHPRTRTPTHTPPPTHPHPPTHARAHSWDSSWSKSGNAGYRWNEATVFAAGSGHTFVRFTYV